MVSLTGYQYLLLLGTKVHGWLRMSVRSDCTAAKATGRRQKLPKKQFQVRTNGSKRRHDHKTSEIVRGPDCVSAMAEQHAMERNATELPLHGSSGP